MERIEVQSDVPMPIKIRCVYPWASMKKGDSFLTSASHGTIRANATYHKVKITIRAEGDKRRAWRAA